MPASCATFEQLCRTSAYVLENGNLWNLRDLIGFLRFPFVLRKSRKFFRPDSLENLSKRKIDQLLPKLEYLNALLSNLLALKQLKSLPFWLRWWVRSVVISAQYLRVGEALLRKRVERPKRRTLKQAGLTREEARSARESLAAFHEGWEAPGMRVYDYL